MKQESNTSRLIIIDGTDGVGKSTQVRLLSERLIAEGFPTLTVKFPWYGSPSAQEIEEYLAGNLEPKKAQDPYYIGRLYAYDRAAHASTITEALEAGTVVVCDRYVAANMGHQGGKIPAGPEREEFFDWLYRHEYEENNLPRPDLNLILHAPSNLLRQGIEKRRNGKKDIHDDDPEHQRRAEDSYLYIAKNFPGFTLVSCYDNTTNTLLPIPDIHELVWQQVKKYIK